MRSLVRTQPKTQGAPGISRALVQGSSLSLTLCPAGSSNLGVPRVPVCLLCPGTPQRASWCPIPVQRPSSLWAGGCSKYGPTSLVSPLAGITLCPARYPVSRSFQVISGGSVDLVPVTLSWPKESASHHYPKNTSSEPHHGLLKFFYDVPFPETFLAVPKACCPQGMVTYTPWCSVVPSFGARLLLDSLCSA